MTASERIREARSARTSDERIIGSDAAYAVGRFNPEGPDGYRSKFGGPLRETRDEAENDYRMQQEHGREILIAFLDKADNATPDLREAWLDRAAETVEAFGLRTPETARMQRGGTVGT